MSYVYKTYNTTLMERLNMKALFKRRKLELPVKPDLSEYADTDLIEASYEYIENVLSSYKSDKIALKKMDIELKYMLYTSFLINYITDVGFEHAYVELRDEMSLILQGLLKMKLHLHAKMMVDAYEKAYKNHDKVIESYLEYKESSMFDDINTYYRETEESLVKAYVTYARKYFSRKT